MKDSDPSITPTDAIESLKQLAIHMEIFLEQLF